MPTLFRIQEAARERHCNRLKKKFWYQSKDLGWAARQRAFRAICDMNAWWSGTNYIRTNVGTLMLPIIQI